MINLEEFLSGKKELEDAAYSLPSLDDEEFSFSFGYHPDEPNEFGWLFITTDYPSYIVFFLGETLPKAIATLQRDFGEGDEEE